MISSAGMFKKASKTFGPDCGVNGFFIFAFSFFSGWTFTEFYFEEVPRVSVRCSPRNFPRLAPIIAAAGVHNCFSFSSFRFPRPVFGPMRASRESCVGHTWTWSAISLFTWGLSAAVYGVRAHVARPSESTPIAYTACMWRSQVTRRMWHTCRRVWSSAHVTGRGLPAVNVNVKGYFTTSLYFCVRTGVTAIYFNEGSAALR